MSKGVVAGHSGFTGELWRSAEPVYDRILAHPFLIGLADGSLPRESFRYYVLQDALYLREYARALSLMAARAQGEDAVVMFAEHAAGAIGVERALHEEFLQDLGVTSEEARNTMASPTTIAYTSYLLRVCSLGDYHEALGAVLPCYWIYSEIGKALRDTDAPDPLYRKWIETYASEDFDALVVDVLALTDHVCHDLTPPLKAKSTEAFRTAARFEWMFWDAAWKLEGWPI